MSIRMKDCIRSMERQNAKTMLLTNAYAEKLDGRSLNKNPRLMKKRLDTTLRRSRLPRRTRILISLQEVEKIKAERCRRSLYYFLREFWGEISQDEFKPNWHINYICHELMLLADNVAKKLPRKYDLIINIPPGSTKSIICSIMFPVWCWLNHFWMRFIVASYSAALSLEHAEYSRDLVRSDKFRKYFPELEIKQDKDTKSNFRIQKRIKGVVLLGGNRYSTSVGGTLTGFHGHILIVDDPLNPQQAVSEVELASANYWMEQTLSTRKIDKAITPTILIMQRLHQDDPTGHILAKKKDNVKLISLPGECRNYAEQVNPPELLSFYADGLLDPFRMGWDVLKDMELDLGQYGYAGQIGQKPSPPGGGMFKVAMLSTVDSMPLLTNVIGCVRAWDKAGTRDGGAYTVGLKLYAFKSGKFIIADIVRGRWSTEERERIIKNTAEADGQDVIIWIEQEPGSGGKESAEATIRNLAGYAIYADRPTGDKIFRADPASVSINNGNVGMLRADWNHEFREELGNFPFSTYKDQVDAFSLAYSKLVRKKEARVLFQRI